MLAKKFFIRANFIESVDTWFPIGNKDTYVFFDVAEEVETHNIPPPTFPNPVTRENTTYYIAIWFTFYKYQIEHSREVYSFFAALGDYGGV